MEESKTFTLPWYVIVGLMLVLSVLSLLLFARPLDTTMKEGETFPEGAITGPSEK